MGPLESREDADHGTLTHPARPQYTAAAKSSSLDAVSKAMENFQATFKKDAQLQKILSAPTLSIEDKQQIVAELQKSTGVTDKTVKQFLETLAANNRLVARARVNFGPLSLTLSKAAECVNRLHERSPLLASGGAARIAAPHH